MSSKQKALSSWTETRARGSTLFPEQRNKLSRHFNV